MRVVLHVCCGICAAGVVERLISEGHEVIGFFYNPNIHPLEEYHRRLDVACRVAGELNFPLVETSYKPEEWLRETESLVDEPEGGKRCEVCFRIRLEQTHLYMEANECDAFTTTLTISRHKSSEVINRVGREVGGDRFLARDFKKQDGFQRSMELAKKWDLYRQNYCGCRYSMRTE